MIDLKSLKSNLKIWQEALDKRGGGFDLKAALQEHEKFSILTQELEALRAQQNQAAKAKDMKAGSDLKKQVATKEQALVDWKGYDFAAIPNIPLSEVPAGGEDKNEVVGQVGKPASMKAPQDHIGLGTKLNILDIERGAKTSGARFYWLKNQAVELEFALVRWTFDLLKKHGFELMVGPQLVNKTAMDAGGYLGKNADEVYKTQDELYLIGTSEQSMLGYHMDEIVSMPKLYAAFSTCFRREAGSHGKDVKGIIRTHQFDKVEMFVFCKPEESASYHDKLVAIQEEILQALEIPYQKVLLAAGDMSSAAAKTIDLESWLPSQNRYRETHSCSNCTDWQARRANVRYEKGKYAHTLNGTAIAVGRLLVALLENHQTENGQIKIPKVLHPYLNFKEIK